MDEQPVWRLDWDDSLSVCIPEVDSEHKRFIRLVNDLNEAIVDRMDRVEILKRMQLILDDAVEHFAHEEALFREWHYPDAEEHATKHAAIVRALHDIMGQFHRKGPMYEWVAAGLKIKEVLIEHLLTEDMKYRDFCSKAPDRTDDRCLPTRKESRQSK